MPSYQVESIETIKVIRASEKLSRFQNTVLMSAARSSCILFNKVILNPILLF